MHANINFLLNHKSKVFYWGEGEIEDRVYFKQYSLCLVAYLEI